jgi:hypothetical protein
MSSYGLAYLLVQWNRLGIDLRFARLGFISGLFFLCGIPMMLALYSMLFSSTPPLRWPPYIPPAIALLNTWMRPEEIVASDMPWAIAWYGNRRGLWVPENPQILSDLADYNTIGGPVNGLYLTPISGSQNKLGDVVKGEYREWASVIMRTGSLPAPFKWGTVLGDADCVFLSDHDRKSAAP